MIRTVAAISIAAMTALVHGQEAEPVQPPSSVAIRGDWDCGLIALCYLLELEGHGEKLGKISGVITEREFKRLSMKELRAVASHLGLQLSAYRLDDNLQLDRPVLVYLSRGPHGHYVILRPVGHTGHLVQILDGTRQPVVRDFEEIRRSPEWTGLALVPVRPNWPARVAWAVGGAGVVGLVVGRVARRKRA